MFLSADATNLYWASLPPIAEPDALFACEAVRCGSSVAEFRATSGLFTTSGGRVVFFDEEAHALRSCAASGCADSFDLMQSLRLDVDALGSDAANVYFHAQEMIYSCPKEGCGQAPRAVAPSGWPRGMTSHRESLYFTMIWGTPMTSGVHASLVSLSSRGEFTILV